jgi:hypothetical protein
MNVTVMVPPALASAVEGRHRLELGIPPSSTVGDVLETLFKLYPKLAQHVANERKAEHQQMNLLLLLNKAGLREGQTLYLFASLPKRLSSALRV